MFDTEKTFDTSYYDQAACEALMRKRGIIVDQETLPDVFNRVVTSIVEADTRLEGLHDQDFKNAVVEFTSDGSFVYGTPVLTNLGRNNLTTAACTVLPLKLREGKVDKALFHEDSYEALGAAIGTGYDLSDLSDPVAELHEMNDVINEINEEFSRNKKRPVACMATLRADHPKVFEFVAAKNTVDFSKWRFNISLFVTEELFQKAEKDEQWELKDNSGAVVETVSACDLLKHIAACAHYCGEPGILFQDRFHRDNPTPHWQYTSTAPCAEVAMAPGEVCQFSYINLSEMYDLETMGLDVAKLRRATEVMTRVLDSSVQVTIDNDFFQNSLIASKRRIGVGVTGFAALLVNLQIPYTSPKAEELAMQIGEIIDFSSKKSSVELAKRRGKFPAYDQSRFTDSDWVKRKYKFTTGVIPDFEWHELFRDIEKYGIRNASTTAYPPTGTSSQLAGTSTSFEPYYQLTQWKMGYVPEKTVPVIYPNVLNVLRNTVTPTILVQLIQELYDPANGFMMKNVESYPYLETARQIPFQVHMRIQSGFQRFADESSSKTINLPKDASVDDVYDAMMYTYALGLKGLTVFRDQCLIERNVSTHQPNSE